MGAAFYLLLFASATTTGGLAGIVRAGRNFPAHCSLLIAHSFAILKA
jgi:hypothetical protein